MKAIVFKFLASGMLHLKFSLSDDPQRTVKEFRITLVFIKPKFILKDCILLNFLVLSGLEVLGKKKFDYVLTIELKLVINSKLNKDKATKFDKVFI